jgi:hypothetical protein
MRSLANDFDWKTVFPRLLSFLYISRRVCFHSFDQLAGFWKIWPLHFNFLPQTILRKVFSPKLDFHRFSVHQSNSKQKRPQIQTPHTELSVKKRFLRKARFLLFSFQPIRFCAKWTSESSTPHRKTLKNAFSRKFDFYWFFTLPPFCTPSPQLLEEIIPRFGSPTPDYLSSIFMKNINN